MFRKTQSVYNFLVRAERTLLITGRHLWTPLDCFLCWTPCLAKGSARARASSAFQPMPVVISKSPGPRRLPFRKGPPLVVLHGALSCPRRDAPRWLLLGDMGVWAAPAGVQFPRPGRRNIPYNGKALADPLGLPRVPLSCLVRGPGLGPFRHFLHGSPGPRLFSRDAPARGCGRIGSPRRAQCPCPGQEDIP
jgi:hypothetical protein